MVFLISIRHLSTFFLYGFSQLPHHLVQTASDVAVSRVLRFTADSITPRIVVFDPFLNFFPELIKVIHTSNANHSITLQITYVKVVLGNIWAHCALMRHLHVTAVQVDIRVCSYIPQSKCPWIFSVTPPVNSLEHHLFSRGLG